MLWISNSSQHFLPSGLCPPFSEVVGVGAMKAFKLLFTLTVLPFLVASVDMLGTEVVLSIVLLAGVWCWTEGPVSVLFKGVALTGLVTGSDPFLRCAEKDVLLAEDSIDLMTIPDFRLELGSLLPLLGMRLPMLLTLVFREEFSLPALK